jgi:hypothetical protein
MVFAPFTIATLRRPAFAPATPRFGAKRRRGSGELRLHDEFLMQYQFEINAVIFYKY